MKAYLLVYSPLYTAEVQKALLDRVSRDPDVRDWWHFLETAYILLSDAELLTMAKKAHTWFPPNHRHLVIEANLAKTGGLLPVQAWDWINQRARSNLSGLIGR
jgi:hypothetical protein